MSVFYDEGECAYRYTLYNIQVYGLREAVECVYC